MSDKFGLPEFLRDIFLYASITIICKNELYNTVSIWEEHHCTYAAGIHRKIRKLDDIG